MTPEIRAEFDKMRALLHQTQEILNETAETQALQAKQLLAHANVLAEHDERMDRVGRHLEVLIEIVDGLIRDSGKKRKKG